MLTAEQRARLDEAVANSNISKSLDEASGWLAGASPPTHAHAKPKPAKKKPGAWRARGARLRARVRRALTRAATAPDTLRASPCAQPRGRARRGARSSTRARRPCLRWAKKTRTMTRRRRGAARHPGGSRAGPVLGAAGARARGCAPHRARAHAQGAYTLHEAATPATDRVQAYKGAVSALLAEFWDAADCSDALRSLSELAHPLYAHYFVKRAVRARAAQRSRARAAAPARPDTAPVPRAHPARPRPRACRAGR
jgi:hypothetical protein